MYQELSLRIKNSYQLTEADLDLPVISIEPVIVYNLYDSRQTWGVECLYSSQSCFPTLQRAKDEAELLRERGKSFYIDQKPAIHFVGENNGLLVADFDSIRPFEDFSTTTSINKRNSTLNHSPLTWFAPRTVISFRKIINHMSREDEFKYVPIYKNLMFRYGKKTEIQLEKFNNLPLNSWRSVSAGGCYSLTWYATNNKTDIRSVIDLAGVFR